MIERTPRPETQPRKQMKVKLPLVLYDVLIFVLTDLLLLVLYRGGKSLSLAGVLQQSLMAFVCVSCMTRSGRNATRKSCSLSWIPGMAK